jgi:hypothetical protein
MDRANRNAAIAAAIFVVGFGVLAFFLPTIMIAVGNVSPIAAGVVAVAFVAIFFVVLWLRARSQRGG